MMTMPAHDDADAAHGHTPPLQLTWGGHAVTLLPERAMWLEQTHTLVVADLHLGKSAAFRHAGIPVPTGTSTATLSRLAALLHRTAATRLIVLGDLFHARSGITPRLDEAWCGFRRKHATLDITLARGNHDQHAGDPPPAWGVSCVNELDEGAWTYRHHPDAAAGRRVIAGHVHPCVRVPQVGAGSARLPCFVLGERVAVLPAFGAFTGMHLVMPGRGDAVYIAAPDGVVPWVTHPPRRRGQLEPQTDGSSR